MCVPAVIAGLAVWAHTFKKKSAFKISPHGWLSKGTANGLVRGLLLGAASGWFPCCSVEPVSGVWGVGLLLLWPLGMTAESHGGLGRLGISPLLRYPWFGPAGWYRDCLSMAFGLGHCTLRGCMR